MGICDNYEAAREIYAAVGVDTDAAIEIMDKVPVSVNCWQIDDLTGFEGRSEGLTGGIAVTGTAPGRPKNQGESEGSRSIPEMAVKTGIPSRSERRRNPSTPPARRIPFPAIRTGRFAVFSFSRI